MRLGLLGGTFDPVHRGHVELARSAGAQGLDAVILVPARRPPHKPGAGMAGAFHRFAMAALAAQGSPKLRVSSFELEREGPSYTIETARHFAQEGHDVTLIMGSDSLAELESWREARALVELARVLVYPRRPALRPGVETRLPGWIRDRLEGPRPGIVWMDAAPDDVSSSDIRERLRRGQAVAGMMPPPVEEYVAKHGLYAGGRP
ncbi:MAG TPA: nicotinate-nucleotide adenylyltransferase [Candidatus Polarisedimenticolia bacterium]|nr:nicotinate-nucleotide adenylyltransferase [Candidatus Polarisedimenticolia bacterium]